MQSISLGKMVLSISSHLRTRSLSTANHVLCLDATTMPATLPRGRYEDWIPLSGTDAVGYNIANAWKSKVGLWGEGRRAALEEASAESGPHQPRVTNPAQMTGLAKKEMRGGPFIIFHSETGGMPAELSISGPCCGTPSARHLPREGQGMGGGGLGGG